MASLYLANVTGNGLTPATAWRPSGFDGQRFTVLMVDEIKGRCVVYSPTDTITGVGITRILNAANRPGLIAFAQNNSPSVAQLNTVRTWCTNAGYTPPTMDTWWNVVHFVARQVNPTADLNRTDAA